MKRMMSQALITWVKSLFTRIRPGTRDGDIEIGGNLEVDGHLTVNDYTTMNASLTVSNSLGIYITDDGETLAFKVNRGDKKLEFYDGYQAEDILWISADPNEVGKSIHFMNDIFIGDTSLSEAQLKKLIALIPAE